MSDDVLPKSIAQSTLNVMGVQLVVHVLDNGKRIIESEGMGRLFEAMENGAAFGPGESEALAKIINGHSEKADD